MKIQNIIQGWTAYLLNEKFALAKARAKFCQDCKFAIIGKYEQILNDEIKEIQGLKCSVCGCPLSPKLRAKKERCPLNKW